MRSVGETGQLRAENGNEIAIVGKSNVGKSSLINFLCGNSKLAKVGKEPGKTRLINYFSIDDGLFTFVDLPGYGFARVSESEKRKWGILIETYLQKSTDLKHVFVLIDIRRDPDDDDRQMLKYLYFYQIPFTILATKCDKISRGETLNRKREVANALGLGADNVIVCSSEKRIGKEEIERRIGEVIGFQ